ncbi:MAG: 8-amino-7-oxononanoate synthase [Proteobacteria bacterium]|nr:8-amino-7-oxononanoate synthase [Pseudomonadota bacterium]
MTRSPWKNRLDSLASHHLVRKMRVVDGPVGPVVNTPEGRKLGFCSNDYLGLANDPALKKAMADAALKWGAGAGASRLVSGNTSAHERLQKILASYLKTEDAVVFPSGYQANVGALTALTQKGDVIFSDELSHASLIDGCRLSGAEVKIYRHRDTKHLNQLLTKETGPGLRLIVTDAVFSMDGNLAPLEEISEIAARHRAQVYVDEAHSLGVIGPQGRGLTIQLGLADHIAVRIGAFGKAFGVCGACVACSHVAGALLRSRARSLLYTTASPAHLVEAISVSVDLVKDGDRRRKALRDNIALFKMLAREQELPLFESETAIQPVLVGETARVMAISDTLWEQGLFVQGIRPPTVPEGTSRFRVTLTAAHERAHITRLAAALAAALKDK